MFLNPFTDLYDDPRSLLMELESEFRNLTSLFNQNSTYIKPRYNHYSEDITTYTLSYELVGVEDKDIHIEVNDTWLKIEYKVDNVKKTINEYLGHLHIGKQYTKATYRNGLLKITLSKDKTSIPVIVPVNDEGIVDKN